MSNVSPEPAGVNPAAKDWTDGLLWALAEQLAARVAAVAVPARPVAAVAVPARPVAAVIRFPGERARLSVV